jgi:hypothetical protein
LGVQTPAAQYWLGVQPMQVVDGPASWVDVLEEQADPMTASNRNPKSRFITYLRQPPGVVAEP